jgi:hypothetical protein
MSLNLDGNQLLLLVAVVGLTVCAVFIPDPTLKAVAVGALAGVVGGHINGSQSASKAAA